MYISIMLVIYVIYIINVYAFLRMLKETCLEPIYDTAMFGYETNVFDVVN